MLKTILHTDRMTVLHRHLEDSGTLRGPGPPGFPSRLGNNVPIDLEDLKDDDKAVVPEHGYPSWLYPLAMYIQQPKFPLVFAQFLYKFSHPDELVAPSTIDECPAFEGAIKVGMEALEIRRVLLFFSFEYWRKNFSCMWVVKQELDRHGQPTLEVIHVDSIAQAAHLLPIYGDSRVPENFHYHCALDSYRTFFVNHYVDHHAHKFIGRD
ncbi:hypothetical protein EDB92DRAFT_1821230 [Lactarius akahatsu]|uniref:Uncharacterized protein n=1 Tax=Lactarius akahatsu TaxID=416441 RepID=A0AAD4Q7S1_9AGAM|nr:hypothetical protein EDB92DRAFT_1821230 [Lactarius akahatsu]